ncbi:hypothetical protein [Paraflavitalea speifideaquila]|uniref:hypothetical protein n=1 Tax=Paraflavitalea speifideaquila TaxID=3076558 RepID=UPI0028ECE54F|nr:hypothetical protein [Paraflavitalea speifideiaquila]
MFTEKSNLNNQYKALLEQLTVIENGESEPSAKLIQCSQHCLELLRQFRKSITANGFPDPDTEIYFSNTLNRLLPAGISITNGFTNCTWAN